MTSRAVYSALINQWIAVIEAKDHSHAISPTAQAILDHLSLPEQDIDELAMLVKADILLCGRIMSIVNSSFFGFPRAISKVDEAIVLIGAGKLKSLVYTHVLMPADARSDSLIFSILKHSLSVAVTMRQLCKLHKKDAEIGFMIGLFHDLPLLMSPPEENIQLDLQSLYDQVVGELNQKVLEQWQLPEVIIEAIKDLYRETACSEYGNLLRISHCIGAIVGSVHDCDMGVMNIERDFEELGLSVREYVKLLPSIDDDRQSMFSLLES